MSISKVGTFIYDHFGFDADTQTADFYYKTDEGHEFHERLEFNHAHVNDYPVSALEEALKFYWLVAGTSYYKAHMANSIEFSGHQVDDWQAETMNTIFKNGLGEFLYVNQLDPEALATFFGFTTDREIAVGKTSVSEAALVPIGGGKDSLVTVSILEQLRGSFETFRINPQGWVVDQMSVIGVPPVTVQRTIDPFLTSDEQQYKGHVPSTVIVSAAAVIAAILGGFSEVIMSNESSADEPTVADYNGMPINHQWAKSHAAGKLVSKWIEKYISKDLRYYSLLRNMNELQICELFSDFAFERFRGLWSSSNENFKHDADGSLSWDINSPKTCAVFALLAPFIDKDELVKEMGGNPFESAQNKEIWDQLQGKTEQKPFECVASIDEIKEALVLAEGSGDWPEVAAIRS